MQDFERTLRFYRLAVVILLGATVWLAVRSGPHQDHASPAPAPSAPPAKEMMLVDLQERFAHLSRTRSESADTSETYFTSDDASVHMHLLGRGQTTPLHIHRKTEEATVVVAGRPLITHAHGRAGVLVKQSAPRRPGTIVLSPTYCAHEWKNPEAEAMQGNLVYGVPGFDGNLYLAADDPRVLRGAAPTIVDPAEELDRFRSTGASVRTTDLPLMRGWMRLVLIRDRFAIAPNSANGASVYHVVAGAGTLAPRGLPLKPQHLLLVGTAKDLELRADPARGLAVVSFTPGARR
jgi:hypothetical protein